MYVDILIDEPWNDCRQTRASFARAWQRNSQVSHGSGMRSVMARRLQRLSLLDQIFMQHGAVTLVASTVESPMFGMPLFRTAVSLGAAAPSAVVSGSANASRWLHSAHS